MIKKIAITLFALLVVLTTVALIIGVNGIGEKATGEPSIKEVMELAVSDLPYIEPEAEEELELPQGKLTVEVDQETLDKQAMAQEARDRLGGRPLAAYAETIAEACYNSGMSVKWFCIIAITESGGGANCFRSCNAWGYGQYSWSSWEEAIPSFCNKFVQGYGSGLTASSHLRYCPGGAYAQYV